MKREGGRKRGEGRWRGGEVKMGRMIEVLICCVGIFRPLEKLGEVRAFVSATLADQSHVFSLSLMGRPILDDSVTLAAFGLVS